MPTKKKRLTRREKAERAAMKKELQARGVLPPDKPRLDRKKFARETWAEFEALFKAKPIRAELALIKAVGFMVGPEMHRVTPEEVGVLKLLKLAVEYDAFLDKLEAEGRETYTTGSSSTKSFSPSSNYRRLSQHEREHQHQTGPGAGDQRGRRGAHLPRRRGGGRRR